MAKRVKRSDASYIAAARQHADLAPSLKKYRKRKRLKPQERAQITRLERKIGSRDTGRKGDLLIPVTAEAWPHVPRNARIKRGVRAIYRPQNIRPPARMTWEERPDPQWLRPQLTVRSADGRKWIFVPAERDELEAQALKIWKRHPDKIVQIDVWVARGQTDWQWSGRWYSKDERRQTALIDAIRRNFGNIGAGYQSAVFPDQAGFDPIIGLKYFVQR